jgi:undecaprenyl-diphosphatase
MEDILIWLSGAATSPLAVLVMFAIVFSETVMNIAPPPPDTILLALSISNPKWAFIFGASCCLGSIIGTPVGYIIGLKGGRFVLKKIVAKKIMELDAYFSKWNPLASGLIAGIMPIPFCLFTIAAGSFTINFKLFILGSCISRSIRFMLQAGLFMNFGKNIYNFIKAHSLIAILAVILPPLLIFVISKYRSPGSSKGGCEDCPK